MTADKWDDWDLQPKLHNKSMSRSDVSRASREAYKSALRKAIEERISLIKYPQGSGALEYRVWDTVFALLDTVQPLDN
jgi:ABC-type phosphate transport system auxiliary subunit